MQYRFYGTMKMGGSVIINANNEQEAREKATRGIFNEFNIIDDQSHMEFIWDFEDPELINATCSQSIYDRIESFNILGVDANTINYAQEVWRTLSNRYSLGKPRVMSADGEILICLDYREHHFEIEIKNNSVEYFYTNKNTDFYFGEDVTGEFSVPFKVHKVLTEFFSSGNNNE